MWFPDSLRMDPPNKFVDRTTASIGFSDMITVASSVSSSITFLRRRSVTMGRWV